LFVGGVVTESLAESFNLEDARRSVMYIHNQLAEFASVV
jgi:hypothetical protein